MPTLYPLSSILMPLRHLMILALLAGCSSLAAAADEFPPVSRLPAQPGLPDPLTSFSGEKITSREQWTKERRPELARLFQYYMYGWLPPAPQKIAFQVDRVDENYFGGKATKKEVTI